MITHVAIRTIDGRIFSLPRPYRHHHVIRVMADVCELPMPLKGMVQGFLINNGAMFVDREIGFQVAQRAGQIRSENTGPTLFSEDLW